MVELQTSEGRYLPVLYPEEAPYWEGARLGRLVLPSCQNCAHLFYPVGPVCPRCLSDDVGWREVGGHGRVSSYVVYHKGWSPWLASRVPYVVAQVQLDEGPRLTSGIRGLEPDQVAVGLEVQAVFEQVTGDISLIQFSPVNNTDVNGQP